MSSLPGYGDEATWPAYSGHPNDPRQPDDVCQDGTPEGDHDWRLIGGDPSVGEGDFMECRECGKTREATEQEVRDSYCDCDDREE